MRDPRRGGILILIGASRLAKALALIATGLVTLRLLKPGVASSLFAWIRDLPIPPGHQFLVETAARFTRLLMRRVWAEYLLIVATVSFIPFEIYELVRGISRGPASDVHPGRTVDPSLRSG